MTTNLNKIKSLDSNSDSCQEQHVYKKMCIKKLCIKKLYIKKLYIKKK